MYRCINKHHRHAQANPCITCEKRNRGCVHSHKLIDTSQFVAAFLEGENAELSFINAVNQDYCGYVTPIQIAHILNRFIEEYHKIKVNNGPNKEQEYLVLNASYQTCMNKLREFQILQFNKKAQDIFAQIMANGTCRMQDHDQMNIAMAIGYNLDEIRTGDKTIEKDGLTIKQISNEINKRNIKINGK